MSDICAVGKFVGGGSYFWKGVRKKGGSDEPPEPPWLWAWNGRSTIPCTYRIYTVCRGLGPTWNLTTNWPVF